MEQKSGEELRDLLEKLHSGALSSRDTYHAIQTLGRMNFLEARPEVERFLSSTDPELRMVALKVLTRYWQLPEHWSTALHILQLEKLSLRGANLSRANLSVESIRVRTILTGTDFTRYTSFGNVDLSTIKNLGEKRR